MLGYFGFSIIHRTLTWTTGSLTCVCALFLHAYTHWEPRLLEGLFVSLAQTIDKVIQIISKSSLSCSEEACRLSKNIGEFFRGKSQENGPLAEKSQDRKSNRARWKNKKGDRTWES